MWLEIFHGEWECSIATRDVQVQPYYITKGVVGNTRDYTCIVFISLVSLFQLSLLPDFHQRPLVGSPTVDLHRCSLSHHGDSGLFPSASGRLVRQRQPSTSEQMGKVSICVHTTLEAHGHTNCHQAESRITANHSIVCQCGISFTKNRNLAVDT